MAIALVSSEHCLAHIADAPHVERPDRLHAVQRGVASAALGDDLRPVEARPATLAEIGAVHSAEQVGVLERIDAAGGGAVDADTVMNDASLRAALLAAGAGLVAVDELRAGRADAAFCAVRPPGHHATPTRSMGFCLLNNVAICAATLAAAGERVAIVDIDAHHGNGTHDAFYGRDDVLFISTHQWPLYPGTGAASERGADAGEGFTMNLPVPPRTGGEEYRRLLGELIGPALADFAPDWVIISAGFDAHGNDPITDLGLSSADYADLVLGIAQTAPAGRLLLFLEGGYDLAALEHSVADVLVGLSGGTARREQRTDLDLGRDTVEALIRSY